ncbi:MAG: Octanoyltransferase [Candidatus Erwinia impunctatus]|nr:Octanoyltransferase [Culicoides impunctatus]
MQHESLIIRQLGFRDWAATSQAMHEFTEHRTQDTPDELWLVQHYPVFTQGQAGKAEHVLTPGAIPVMQSDRGGQVTYHGLGQQIVYVLLDIRRKKMGVRTLVTALEQSVIDTLAHFSVEAVSRPDAPGVYVADKKICSLGLRIRHGCSFHGLALNINMDLSPFRQINPCGYAGLQMTQLCDLVPDSHPEQATDRLVQSLVKQLSFPAHAVINVAP